MEKIKISNEFKRILKDLRTEKGLSQDEFAKELGISKGAVSYYETGQRVPDIVVLSAIADYFEVSTDFLLGRTETKSVNEDVQAACKVTGLSEKAIYSLMLAEDIGYDWLTSTINFILEDIYGELYETVKIEEQLILADENDNPIEHEKGSHLLVNLMYYLNTRPFEKQSSIHDEIMISKSGRLIDETTNYQELEKTTVDDIITVKTVKKSEIINKVLYDDVCESIKTAKHLYQAQKKAGD